MTIELRKYGIEELRANVDPDTLGGRLACPVVARLPSFQAFLRLYRNTAPRPACLEGYKARLTSTVFGVEFVNADGDWIFPM